MVIIWMENRANPIDFGVKIYEIILQNSSANEQ